ncbi:hypothetical protein PUN28_001656 [Cardiocondyla obscurior]|uniref:Secreted protein n=1 Tax=Cardiocondyla obscurior TaxID=286306 RepID=A0AAW2GQL6_9HYME
MYNTYAVRACICVCVYMRMRRSRASVDRPSLYSREDSSPVPSKFILRTCARAISTSFPTENTRARVYPRNDCGKRVTCYDGKQSND